MRILEIVILCLLCLILLGFFFPRNKRSGILLILASVSAFMFLFHWIWEKARWQMAPAYALILVLFLITIAHFKWKREKPLGMAKKIGKALCVILGLAVLAATATLATILPVCKFPKPLGTYPVGTTILEFTDTSRPETLTEDPNDYRKIMVKAWYPAEPDYLGKPEFYWQHAAITGPLLAQKIGLPSFFFSHLGLIETNSYHDATIAKAQPSYPVVIFSCGYGSLVNEYTLQMEELASQGYIVFSIANTYETMVVVYPDGKVVPFSESLEKEFSEASRSDIEMWGRYAQCKEENGKCAIAREILKANAFMDKILRIRTADIRFLADELEKINSGKNAGIFTGRLDLSRLGVLGHSMGGAVAGQICLVDSRFKAGVNMDGFQFGDMLQGKLERPFMMMYSEPFRGVNNFLEERMKNTTYILTIRGSTHINYSDNPFILPILQKTKAAGAIDSLRMREIVNGYIVAFFEKHLRSKENSSLAGDASPYPEVIWKVLNR